MGDLNAAQSIVTQLQQIKSSVSNLSGPAAYKRPVTWSSTTPYSPGPPADVVRVTNFGAYVCVTANTNINPTTDNGTNWTLLVLDGATGPTGASGPTGQGYNFKGAWTATTNYAVLDAVSVGSAPNQLLYICVLAHTSGSVFSQGANWAPGGLPGPAGFAAMIWQTSQYVKASDGTPGRPASASFPGGTVFYIGPNAPTDSVTNDLWFNQNAA